MRCPTWLRATVVAGGFVAAGCGGGQAREQPLQPQILPAVAQPTPSATAAADPAPPTTPQASVQPEPVQPSPFRLPVVAAERTRVRVLMYHSIGWFPPRPGVNPRKLRDQLTWLRDNDVEVIRLSQLLDFMDGKLALPERVAVITIDDGELNGYSVAFPIFREHEVPFALGIATEAIEKWQSRGTMQWHQLREMVESGLCEIASHSHTHRNLRTLAEPQLRRELDESRSLIEQHTGYRPQAFFYPLGAHNARVRQFTRDAGYRAGFLAWGAPVKNDSRRFRLNRYAVEKGTGLYTFARYFSHGD